MMSEVRLLGLLIRMVVMLLRNLPAPQPRTCVQVLAQARRTRWMLWAFAISMSLYGLCGQSAHAIVLFDAIETQMQEDSNSMFGSVVNLATRTFGILAVIELCWAAAIWAFERDNLSSLAVEMIKKIMFIGFFYTLLLNGQSWIPSIVAGFQQVGTSVTGVQLSTDNILTQGIQTMADLWAATIPAATLMASAPEEEGGFGIPGVEAADEVAMEGVDFTIMVSLVVVVAYAIVAAQYFMIKAEASILLAAGAVFLGLGASSWTKEYTQKYINYAVTVGVRLLVLTIILSYTLNIINQRGTPAIIFSGPARNTAVSHFKIHDLMNTEDPVSLYLVVPPSDKDRLRPLIRLVVTQIVRGLTEKMAFEGGRSVAAYKHRLLLMLDEFPSLGKLDVFEESLAFIAGYGLKAYLIIQDISQLWTAYGKDESIFSNCHVRVAYAPNKIETAELLSKMVGTATMVKHNEQYSGGLFGGKTNVTNSTQESQRPLLTADEVMRLPAARKDAEGNVIEPGDMLIFMAGQTPIYGKQILYFMDPTFSQRARLPAPEITDVIRVEKILMPDRGKLYPVKEVAPARPAADNSAVPPASATLQELAPLATPFPSAADLSEAVTPSDPTVPAEAGTASPRH